MSQSMFDKESWSRSMGPAIRVVGYTAAMFLLTYLLILLPITILVNNFGFPEIVAQLVATLLPIFFVFFFTLSIFKVLDEELAAKK